MALGRLVHAPAGLGKTRALIEIAEELTRAHGWLAGFVPRDVRGAGRELSERDLERLIRNGRDAAGLMLIVDYAESRQEDVTWLADRLVERTQAVSKMGVEAFISTGGLAVTSDHLTFGKDDRWLIIGGPDVLLEDALWDEVPEALRRAAAFHKLLLARLFSVWRSNFLRAFDLGAIHMMARKNSILAPFERVTPDQWYVFKCDDQDEPPVKVDWSETRLATLQRAPRCGAKTRTGRFCQCPALRDRKRCRLHGGLSPGAPRGRKNGNFTNGDWTAEAIEERRWLRSLVLSFAKKGTGP